MPRCQYLLSLSALFMGRGGFVHWYLYIALVAVYSAGLRKLGACRGQDL